MKKTTDWRLNYVVVEPSQKEIRELENGFIESNNLDLSKILTNSKRKLDKVVQVATLK
jgi:hypothetical protein